VVDSQEVTGQCVHLYLWSQQGIEADWLPVAQNTMLVTPDFRNSEGESVFCELGGHQGARSYDLPMSKVPAGWYVVCNLSNECTAPFEKV
jgi:hypothetical protein